jgi:hypothetical protein
LFYEGRDAIGHIRNPFAEGTEGKTRKASENETPEQKEAYDKAYVLIERYNTHVELFNKLHSMRYRFMAQFGEESAKPFVEFRKILSELIVSARSLARSWARLQRTFRTEEQERRHYNHIEKQEAIFWEGLAEEDPIVPRVNACIQEIEAICRPILADRQTVKTFVNSVLNKAKNIIAND